MVKVVVVGSTGKSGSRIVKELINRGHTVVAVARDPSKVEVVEGITAVKGDVLVDDLIPIFEGSDVVVSAYAPAFESLETLLLSTQKLVSAVKAANVSRFILVGGAGGLTGPGGILVINQEWFPEAWKGIAQAHIDTLEYLKTTDINWTVWSPPGYFEAGERKGPGSFRLDLENLVADSQYKSAISFEDGAVVIVDEIENPQHERLRFTAGYV
eukprot:gene11612-15550_t